MKPFVITGENRFSKPDIIRYLPDLKEYKASKLHNFLGKSNAKKSNLRSNLDHRNKFFVGRKFNGAFTVKDSRHVLIEQLVCR